MVWIGMGYFVGKTIVSTEKMAQDGCADAWFGDSELAAEGFDNNVGSLGCFTLYSYFIGFYWLSGRWWYPWDGGPEKKNQPDI